MSQVNPHAAGVDICPEADLVALRHRAQLLEHRAPHIMQKALLQMNVQLSQVLSDGHPRQRGWGA